MLKKTLYIVVLVGLAILANGCQCDTPRMRIGNLPTSTPGSNFLDPNKLGKHHYNFSPFERGGIVYTCKAGHIDVTHLRLNADYTKYLINKTRQTLTEKGDGYSFSLPFEVTTHKVAFDYPENWASLSQKEKENIAKEIAFETGSYLAFNAAVWHEIITWFDVHLVGIEPQFRSAFSWEDVYSNLLGTKLAVEVLKDTDNDYDTAMTSAIDSELRRLGVQPRETAIQATEKVRGKWFTGNFIIDATKRNFDIGLDDGFVTPSIVPGICDSSEPEKLPVPRIDKLSKYGFTMTYEIHPKEWERDQFLSIVYPDGNGKTIRPDEHFPIIIATLKKQAVEKFGYDVD